MTINLTDSLELLELQSDIANKLQYIAKQLQPYSGPAEAYSEPNYSLIKSLIAEINLSLHNHPQQIKFLPLLAQYHKVLTNVQATPTNCEELTNLLALAAKADQSLTTNYYANIIKDVHQKALSLAQDLKRLQQKTNSLAIDTDKHELLHTINNHLQELARLCPKDQDIDRNSIERLSNFINYGTSKARDIDIQIKSRGTQKEMLFMQQYRKMMHKIKQALIPVKNYFFGTKKQEFQQALISAKNMLKDEQTTAVASNGKILPPPY